MVFFSCDLIFSIVAILYMDHANFTLANSCVEIKKDGLKIKDFWGESSTNILELSE